MAPRGMVINYWEHSNSCAATNECDLSCAKRLNKYIAFSVSFSVLHNMLEWWQSTSTIYTIIYTRQGRLDIVYIIQSTADLNDSG